MMQQRSPEWFAARLGKVTSSRINDVMAKLKSGGEAASRRNYRVQLAVERITGEPTSGFCNEAMRHGIEMEPFARETYEFLTEYSVEQVGFIDHPEIEMFGASPDGLIGDDGMVEIKCPTTATHVEWLLGKQVPPEHINQMQGQMDCAGRAWCDFVSYDPRMPIDLQLFKVRLLRDNDRIADIRGEVKKLLSEVDELVASLERERTE